MRITFVLPVVNMSGGIRVPAIYAKALMQMGHKVVLVSLPPDKTPLRRKIKAFLSGKGWPQNIRKYKSHLDGQGFDHRVLDQCRIPINKDVPDGDVVVATWWETAEWVNELGKEKGAKVYFIQGHEVFPHLPVERVHATYRLPFHHIVIASWLQKIMNSLYGKATVDLVHNSVDHTQFFAPQRNRQSVPTVGFLYNKIPLKGVEVTLLALAKLKKVHPNLRAVCFGSQSPTIELPLEDWIEFQLEPEQDHIKDIYAQCDVWITSSRTEGFNLTAMEAMACRTPIVSTRTGWPIEAIDSYKNGVLVDIDDVEGIVAGVQWVLGLSDSEWQKLSEAAYKTVENSSWEKSAKLFEKALIHACERAQRGEIAGGIVNETIKSC
jgi:glycosyltransferase involved in cell wall biosynthesis